MDLNLGGDGRGKRRWGKKSRYVRRTKCGTWRVLRLKSQVVVVSRGAIVLVGRRIRWTFSPFSFLPPPSRIFHAGAFFPAIARSAAFAWYFSENRFHGTYCFFLSPSRPELERGDPFHVDSREDAEGRGKFEIEEGRSIDFLVKCRSIICNRS